MALLHACVRCSKRSRITIEAAHVDHGVRSASREDASFVESLCSEWGVPLHLKRLAPPRGRNMEKWGREERYKFFEEVLKSRALDLVLTAHNANDVAETLLMRLVANKELYSIERYSEKRKCLRPLLGVSRAQIDRYIKTHGLSFVEDTTNADTLFLRNKVRHVLIPHLESHFDPRIVEVLSERALAMDEDEAFLRDIASRLLGKPPYGIPSTRDGLRLLSRRLEKAPFPLRWRAVSQLLLNALGYRPGRDAAGSAAAVLTGSRTGAELAGGYVLRRVKGSVKLGRKSDHESERTAKT